MMTGLRMQSKEVRGGDMQRDYSSAEVRIS